MKQIMALIAATAFYAPVYAQVDSTEAKPPVAAAIEQMNYDVTVKEMRKAVTMSHAAYKNAVKTFNAKMQERNNAVRNGLPVPQTACFDALA